MPSGPSQGAQRPLRFGHFRGCAACSPVSLRLIGAVTPEQICNFHFAICNLLSLLITSKWHLHASAPHFLTPSPTTRRPNPTSLSVGYAPKGRSVSRFDARIARK